MFRTSGTVIAIGAGVALLAGFFALVFVWMSNEELRWRVMSSYSGPPLSQVYEIDKAALLRPYIEEASDAVSALDLAQPKLPYTDLNVADGAIRLKVANPDDQQRAVKILQDALVSTGHMPTNEIAVSLSADGLIEIRPTPDYQHKLVHAAALKSVPILRNRIDAIAARAVRVEVRGDDRIMVRMLGAADPGSIARVLATQGRLTFHLVDMTVSPEDAQLGRVPPGTIVVPSDDQGEPFVAVKRRSELTGEDLVDASGGYLQSTGAPIVNFRFNERGDKMFCRLTSNHVGDRFALLFDDKVLAAPRINTRICGGSGYIEGNFTVQSASELAAYLRAGALPAPLKLIEQRRGRPSSLN